VTLFKFFYVINVKVVKAAGALPSFAGGNDMPQHIVVEICKSYLPSSSLEVFYIIFPIDVYV